MRATATLAVLGAALLGVASAPARARDPPAADASLPSASSAPPAARPAPPTAQPGRPAAVPRGIYSGSSGKKSDPGTACSTARTKPDGTLDCGMSGKPVTPPHSK